jgi:uncharacterized protein
MKTNPNCFYAKIIIGALELYQRFISQFLLIPCRYTPSCSEYMIQAILYHGIIRGFSLGIMRIFRCHAFAKGGDDQIDLLYYSYFKNNEKL